MLILTRILTIIVRWHKSTAEGTSMVRSVAAVAIIGFVVIASERTRAAEPPARSAPPPQGSIDARAAIDKYCVTCHNQRLKTGALTLDTADLANVPGNAERLEKRARNRRGGAMPPR